MFPRGNKVLTKLLCLHYQKLLKSGAKWIRIIRTTLHPYCHLWIWKRSIDFTQPGAKKIMSKKTIHVPSKWLPH
ncbi:hypothetical protein GGQ73_000482 [Rhizobium skierniewicense]|uniref:Uncharacterized protein n=1 Tax=Rhizobium skierniewicense TaxID=984260 RepID=A0A7W6C4Z5_9HYPH|nr:hypothetical protein [Rhizobium skierniewicense]